MVDTHSEAGGEAVERQRRAARETDTLGPGTAGHTTSGAAYRGHEVAANTGAPSPAEIGFPDRTRGGKMDDDGPA